MELPWKRNTEGTAQFITETVSRVLFLKIRIQQPPGQPQRTTREQGAFSPSHSIHRDHTLSAIDASTALQYSNSPRLLVAIFLVANPTVLWRPLCVRTLMKITKKYFDPLSLERTLTLQLDGFYSERKDRSFQCIEDGHFVDRPMCW